MSRKKARACIPPGGGDANTTSQLAPRSEPLPDHDLRSVFWCRMDQPVVQPANLAFTMSIGLPMRMRAIETVVLFR